jgi:hypothetical protein
VKTHADGQPGTTPVAQATTPAAVATLSPASTPQDALLTHPPLRGTFTVNGHVYTETHTPGDVPLIRYIGESSITPCPSTPQNTLPNCQVSWWSPVVVPAPPLTRVSLANMLERIASQGESRPPDLVWYVSPPVQSDFTRLFDACTTRNQGPEYLWDFATDMSTPC